MPNFSPVRILCVNDRDTCELIELFLCDEGYEFVLADGVEGAQRNIHSQKINLYILDYWFRDGTGIELCRKIREFDKTTPIVFYSAAARNIDKQKAIEAGADAYLFKPNGWIELINTISALLQQNHQRISNLETADK